MKPIEKMNYKACLREFGNSNAEVILFVEDFWHKHYEVLLAKEYADIITVKVNNEDFAYISEFEVGFMFENDPEGNHLSFKANLSTVFLPVGYRITFNRNDNLILNKKDGSKQRINKMVVISLQDDGVIIE